MRPTSLAERTFCKIFPPCSSLPKLSFSNPLPAANPFLICVYASFPTGGNIRKHLRGKSAFLGKKGWLVESFVAQLFTDLAHGGRSFVINGLSVPPALPLCCYCLCNYRLIAGPSCGSAHVYLYESGSAGVKGLFLLRCLAVLLKPWLGGGGDDAEGFCI